MKIYTSYFYQLRFFKKNMIPLSTAIWDPKWFKRSVPQKDANGVYLGLRAEPFVPNEECHGLCGGRATCADSPDKCAFLIGYRKQLDKLNFQEIMERFERLGNYIQSVEGFAEEPIMVLMVYEAPTQQCSERKVIQDWFAANGYSITEWNKN